VPVSRLVEGEIEKLMKMEDRLHERVIGRTRRLRPLPTPSSLPRGLSDPNRPLGSFIFLGPTGVGKTELARALAQFLFDDDQAMVRIDMSEYMESHSVSRLIGAPPGYVGYEEGGQLTEGRSAAGPTASSCSTRSRRRTRTCSTSFCRFWMMGRATDGQGRTVDFKNAVIIMTSNLGSTYIMSMDGDEEATRERVMDALRSNFRPEFLNRIDEIIIFKPLSQDQIGEIVTIQLNQVNDRLADRQMHLEVTPAAREWLSSEATSLHSAQDL
jgi:ATP-dependent Clp protease ATP-binding subunit ClpB